MSRAAAALAALAAALVAAGDRAVADVVAERAARYREFLDQGRTAERSVRLARHWAAAAGFRELDPYDPAACQAVVAGDRLVLVWQDRTALLLRVGRQRAGGMALVGAHVDAPALRLAPRPIERPRAGGGELLRAYPYGGIKAFHYRGRPLRLVGQVVRAGGDAIDLDLGPEHGVSFVVAGDGRGGDSSVALLASSSGSPDESFAAILQERFGLTAADLEAAEIYAVAAAGAREVGLDRAMIGAAGQDDRSLSYAALQAILGHGEVEHTAAVLLVDREEVGSTGRTGAQAPLLAQAAACLARGAGVSGARVDAAARRMLARSVALSADVKAALHPSWPEVQDPANAAYMGRGPTLVTFTGSRGKRGASDAHPALFSHVRRLAAAAGVPVQHSHSGKVDEGGGGTIAKFLAEYEIDVLDVGVPLLSMHAPFELIGIDDLSFSVDLLAAFLRAGPPGSR